MKKEEIICPIEFDDSLIKRKVKFSVPGKPFGKQRPRFVRRGRFVSTYTPQETVDYENKVKKSYKQTVGNIKLNGAIEADITGIFPISSSTSKKMATEMLDGKIPCTKKPDCDNIEKSVLDALNEIAYDDDSQVTDVNGRKRYGKNPRVDVTLREITALEMIDLNRSINLPKSYYK